MLKLVVLFCVSLTVFTSSSPVEDPKGIIPKPNVVIGTFIGRMVDQDLVSGIMPDGGLEEFHANRAKEEDKIREDNLIFS